VEAELALEAGMRMVLWASYLTVTPANISHFVANARRYPAVGLPPSGDPAFKIGSDSLLMELGAIWLLFGVQNWL
jgi:hypothetical protein